MKNRIIKTATLCALILFLFIGCKKTKKTDANTLYTTYVKGVVQEMDGLPIENLTLKIGEYKSEFGAASGLQDRFQRWLADTRTNKQGMYEMHFDGYRTGGFSYKIVVEPELNSIAVGYGDAHKIGILGGEYTYNPPDVLKLYPRNLTIQMDSVKIFPLSFRQYLMNFSDSAVLILDSATVTKRIFMPRFMRDEIIFTRNDGNGLLESARYMLDSTSSTELTTQTIIVKEQDFQ